LEAGNKSGKIYIYIEREAFPFRAAAVNLSVLSVPLRRVLECSAADALKDENAFARKEAIKVESTKLTRLQIGMTSSDFIRRITVEIN
jgi:hypothetical protein